MQKTLIIITLSFFTHFTTLTSKAIEDESFEELVRVFTTKIISDFQGLQNSDRRYMITLFDAQTALRAHFGVRRNTYRIYGIDLVRPEAAKLARIVLMDLNSSRLHLAASGGLVTVLDYEFTTMYLELSYQLILEYFVPNKSYGVYEAIYYGELEDYLSRARIAAAIVQSANLDDWPEWERSIYETERDKYLSAYRKLLNFVAKEPRARSAFQRSSFGESFSSLFIGQDPLLEELGNSKAKACDQLLD